MDDATRYRWLKQKVEFKLAGYNGPDHLSNATRSSWSLRTGAIFDGNNQEPESIDAAIDAAILEEERKLSESHSAEAIERIYEQCKGWNWDGDGALPITRETAAGALMLMNGLRSAGLDSVAMPEPDGMIQFEFYEEPNRVVSMSIDNTPKVYWAAHDGTQSIGHGVLTVSESIEQLPQVIRETLVMPKPSMPTL